MVRESGAHLGVSRYAHMLCLCSDRLAFSRLDCDVWGSLLGFVSVDDLCHSVGAIPPALRSACRCVVMNQLSCYFSELCYPGSWPWIARGLNEIHYHRHQRNTSNG